MVDLVPDGCMSLRDAYDRFGLNLWNGHSPVADLGHDDIYRYSHPLAEARRASLNVTERMLADFAHAFANGSLAALVRFPGATESLAIPVEAWRDALDAHNLFLGAEIAPDSSGRLSAFVGRTPFVIREQLDPWLAAQIARKSDPNVPQSSSVGALTEHLIELARNGLISSMQVEEFAKRWGLSPFESRPIAEKFDPMKLARWTLCMAASWIVWRNLDAVREAMDGYRAAWRVWVPRYRRWPTDSVGHSYDTHVEELETLEPMGLFTMRVLESQDINPGADLVTMSIRSAREVLWMRLAEGALVASAVNTGRQVTDVPACEWGYLELAGSQNGTDHLVFKDNLRLPAYTKITVLRTAVLDVWREISGAPTTRTKFRSKGTTSTASARDIEAGLSPIGIQSVAFAVDEATKRVLFRGGPVLTGKSFELVARLASQHRQDVEAGLELAKFNFVQTRILIAEFDVTDVLLRRRVERARRALRQQFYPILGPALTTRDIIENLRWRGYRLNPDLIRVEVHQIA